MGLGTGCGSSGLLPAPWSLSSSARPESAAGAAVPVPPRGKQQPAAPYLWRKLLSSEFLARRAGLSGAWGDRPASDPLAQSLGVLPL